MRPSLAKLLLVAVVFLAGCQPHIGDSCTLPTDCSATGVRLCEPSFPGGYCTIFNCVANKCPDEALCVSYGSVVASEPECANPANGRFQRTFCMLACSSNSDCRTDQGYACVDLGRADQNPWGAIVLDSGSRHKICTVPASVAPDPGPHPAGVCNPPLDASFPPEPDGAPSPPDAATDGGVRPDAAPDAARDASTGSPPDAGAGDGAPRDAQGGS